MIRHILIILTMITLFGCGFKLANKQIDFKTNVIETSGQSRINYKIKNAIKFQENENSKKIYNLKIETNKNKFIEDRNSKNEITKYRISLKANFKLLDLNNILIKEYNFEPSAIYGVADNYSQNLDREKQTIDILIREIEKEILDIFKNDL